MFRNAFLCTTVWLALAACGDLGQPSDGDSPSDGSAVSGEGNSGASGNTGTAQDGGMCLTDCDNGQWKFLTTEELVFFTPQILEGCSLVKSAAFPNGIVIDVLGVVSCSGLQKLYRWSVNNMGRLVDAPKQIAQCSLGHLMSQLRRSAGKGGALTLWNCTEGGTSYYKYSYYSVLVEGPNGEALYTKLLKSSSSASAVEVAYAQESEQWAVVFSGQLIRLNAAGVMGGSTSWSGRAPRNIVVRDGVFQIMEGSEPERARYCTRVTMGGTLLCDSFLVGYDYDSVQPIEGSRLVLLQDGSELRAGADSGAGCSITGEALTVARHAEEHSTLRALAVGGTPYFVALSKNQSSLVLNLFRTAPSMQHLTALPLADSDDWDASQLRLFVMGERIYVSFVTDGMARIISIPKPEGN